MEKSEILSRPSTNYNQNIAHVLSHEFPEIFGSEVIDPVFIKNLEITKAGNNSYHEDFVNRILKIVQNHATKIGQYDRIEKHILQAKAKALAADEREKNRNASANSLSHGGQHIKLPPSYSIFRACLDNDYLQQSRLICPADLNITSDPNSVQARIAGMTATDDALPHLHSATSSLYKPTSSSMAKRAGNRDAIQPSQPSQQSKPSTAGGAGGRGERERRYSLDSLRYCASDCEPEDKAEHASDPPINSERTLGILSATSKFRQESGVPSRHAAAADGGGRRSLSIHSRNEVDGRTAGHTAGNSTVSKRHNKRKCRQDSRFAWKQHMNQEQRTVDRVTLDLMQRRVNYLLNSRYLEPINWPDWLSTGKWPFKCSLSGGAALKEDTVWFTDYVVGQVYEKKLELTNTSAFIRMCRMLPPRTKYFSIGLGQFPGDQGGNVAPGMHCSYTVRFAPDCLGDYEDQLTVESDFDQNKHEPMTISIRAERPRPRLTLPSVIDVGHCLVFGQKMLRINVENLGGKGRFAFVPKKIWPTSNFKSAITSTTLSTSNFQIRPAIFELFSCSAGADKKQRTTTEHQSNQQNMSGSSTKPSSTTKSNSSFILEISFMPDQEGPFEQDLMLLCDNCHLSTVKLIGEAQLAKVTYLPTVDGVCEQLDRFELGELRDVSVSTEEVQSLIRFTALHPYTLAQRVITIENNCNVDLNFIWKFVKPIFQLDELPVDSNENSYDHADHSMKLETSHNRNVQMRTLDASCPFAVIPQHGVISAAGKMQFNLIFAPSEVKSYDSILSFILEDIPDLVTTPTPQDFSQIHQQQRHHSTLSHSLLANEEAPVAISMSNGTLPTNQTKQTQPANASADPTPPSIALFDLTGLSLHLKGQCVPLKLQISPSNLIIPSVLLVGMTTRRQIRVFNPNLCSINISWTVENENDDEDEADTNIVCVEPALGIIESGCEGYLEVLITGTRPGPLKKRLKCILEQHNSVVNAINESVAAAASSAVASSSKLPNQMPVELLVQAQIKGAELEIASSRLVDFALVAIGDNKTRTKCVTVRNPTSIECTVSSRIIHKNVNPEIARTLYRMELTPDRMVLGPFESRTVQLHLTSLRQLAGDDQLDQLLNRLAHDEHMDLHAHHELSALVQFDVVHGETSFVQVTGHMQHAHLRFADCELVLKDLFVRVPTTYQVELINQTLLPAYFDWNTATTTPTETENSVLYGWANIDECVRFDRVEPATGTLAARESVKIALTFTALRVASDIEEFFVNCQFGSDPRNLCVQQLPLRLVPQISDLKIAYNATINSEQNSLSVVDFNTVEADGKSAKLDGDIVDLEVSQIATTKDVDLYAMEIQQFRMKNLTSIETQFSIAVEHFMATIDSENCNEVNARLTKQYDKSSEQTEASDATELILKKTANLADPNSKSEKHAKYDFVKSLLRKNRGCAFHCFPSSGRLGAFECVTITVVAVNDMWGEYRDDLLIRVGHLPVHRVPIHMNVVGNPIEFTMTAGRPDNKAIYRFGSHPINAPCITRQIRLNNKSPCDLMIHWQMFSKVTDHQHHFSEGREKLLDLILNFNEVNMVSHYLSDAGDKNTVDEYDAECGEKTERSTDELDVVKQTEINLGSGEQMQICDLIEATTQDQQQSVSTSRLISLVMMPHEGEPKASQPLLSDQRVDEGDLNIREDIYRPFHVVNSLQRVPASSYGFLDLSFNPAYCASQIVERAEPASTEAPKEQHGYLLGYLYLLSEDAYFRGKLTRPQNYLIDPIRLDFTGRSIIPRLELEYLDMEDDAVEDNSLERDRAMPLKFRLPISNLLEHPSETAAAAGASSPLIQSRLKSTSRVRIRNNQDTSVKFVAHITEMKPLTSRTREEDERGEPEIDADEQTTAATNSKHSQLDARFSIEPSKRPRQHDARQQSADELPRISDLIELKPNETMLMNVNFIMAKSLIDEANRKNACSPLTVGSGVSGNPQFSRLDRRSQNIDADLNQLYFDATLSLIYVNEEYGSSSLRHSSTQLSSIRKNHDVSFTPELANQTNFVNSDSSLQQTFKITAQLYFPELQVSTCLLEFGTCFVNQPVERSFRVYNLSNHSESFLSVQNDESQIQSVHNSRHFSWHPKWVRLSTADSLSANQVSSSSSSSSAPSSCLISVKFTATKPGKYEHIITVSGMLGDGRKQIKLVAEASMDEQFYKVFED